MLQHVFERCLSALTHIQSLCHSFIVLSMIRFSKSAQEYFVQVCQVANVVMEIVQLVLSKLKKLFTVVNRELNEVYPCQK